MKAEYSDSGIPSIEGAEEKLKAGGKVADIGCGLGSTTILMAETYPNSQIFGYDFHEPSIKEAQERANEKGLTNITFQVADSKDISEKDFDLACIFDALHDMGDPVGVASGIKDFFYIEKYRLIDGLKFLEQTQVNIKMVKNDN